MKKLAVLSVFGLMMASSLSAQARLKPQDIPVARDLTQKILIDSIQLIGEITRDRSMRLPPSVINLEDSSHQLFRALLTARGHGQNLPSEYDHSNGPGQPVPGSMPHANYDSLFSNMEISFNAVENDLRMTQYLRHCAEIDQAIRRLRSLFSPWNEVRLTGSYLLTEAAGFNSAAEQENRDLQNSPHADLRSKARARMVVTQADQIQGLVRQLVAEINQPHPNMNEIGMRLNDITRMQSSIQNLVGLQARRSFDQLSMMIERIKQEIARVNY